MVLLYGVLLICNDLAKSGSRTLLLGGIGQNRDLFITDIPEYYGHDGKFYFGILRRITVRIVHSPCTVAFPDLAGHPQELLLGQPCRECQPGLGLYHLLAEDYPTINQNLKKKFPSLR